MLRADRSQRLWPGLAAWPAGRPARIAAHRRSSGRTRCGQGSLGPATSLPLPLVSAAGARDESSHLRSHHLPP